MKRLLTLTLLATALLLCMALIACTGDFSAEDTTSDTTPAAPVTDAPTEPLTEEPTAAPTEKATEAPTEPVTELDTLSFAGYNAEPRDQFLYNTAGSTSTEWITKSNAFGTRIKVEENCVLNDLTYAIPGRGSQPETGTMELHLYRWDTDYETTLAAGPMWLTTVGPVPSGSWMTTTLPSMVVGEGEWLVLFCNSTGKSIGVQTTNALQATTDAGVTVIEGYRKGETHSRIPCLYAAYTRYTPDGTEVTPQPFTTLTPGKAHVIIISGQSNAAGQSHVSYLENTASPDAWARYQAGYENILIDSAVNGGANVTNGFVPVRLGLGASTATYGPEVGLADYLSRTYPDETFYIIKAAWSGAGLSKHFQDHRGEYQYIRGYITASLERMKQAGLDPEIFAFCWMQGETDACYMEDSICYAEMQDDLIARLTAVCDGYVAPGGFAFLDAQISTSTAWPYAGIVNRQKMFCADLSPNRYFLDTNTPDIDCRDENNDIAHYDSDDMIELGELFGQYVKLVLDNAGWSGD